MSVWVSSTAAGSLVGMASFAVLRLAFGDIETSNFGALIGLSALAGAGLTSIWLRRRKARPAKSDHDAS